MKFAIRFVQGVGEGITLATIENRFVQPHPLGWRDVNLLLKVRLPANGKVHIMEAQGIIRPEQDHFPVDVTS